MYFLILLLSVLSISCDSKPDKPEIDNVIVSHDIPRKDGQWVQGARLADGTITPYRIPQKHLDWGAEYEITTQVQWNSFNGLYGLNFISLNKTTDRTGSSYELVGIELAHFEVFDSKSGIGRFSNKRRKCGLKSEYTETRGCGRKFIAEGKVIVEVQSIVDGSGKATLVMEHKRWPEPDRVVSIKPL